MGPVETTLIDHRAGPSLWFPTHKLSLSPHLYTMGHNLLQDDGLFDWGHRGCLQKRGDHELYMSPETSRVGTEEPRAHLRPDVREGAGEIGA